MHHCWIAAEPPPTKYTKTPKKNDKIYNMQHGLRTGNTGSERDEGNRVHSVLEVDKAAKMSGDISDDSSTGADREDGNDKGGVAITKGWEK